ncbi:bifunctional chorismate mutase/prephenate dehydrogenase T-protein [Artemisia annua]|uniref:Bifunctional chorismate mutase/prephenate dehydrogenase T-protein n=1 Tax=Artemisia annua TaxID=35608 RepID=A0A2U1M0R7_ARTAN|nr:bifunctional chorismate mutase/prephenate dehydrogenase T-protein [Artemisia annua]
MSCDKTKEVLEDSDLVCTHPMFGQESGKDWWKDLNFMYERKARRTRKEFEKLVQVKENTVNDSFDLYSGRFIHNRFAKQQMESLESALTRVKESLEARMNKQNLTKLRY